MAEIIDHDGKSHEVATNCKANTALGFGIAGTALGVLGGGMAALLGTKGNSNSSNNATCMTSEDLYIERKQAADQLAATRETYEWKLDNLKNLTDAFFESYRRDTDNYAALNQKIVDSSFGLYKNQRDEKDALMAKINEVDKKVDMMAAIRPYQDALINCKIDKASLISDFNLAKRTCRMIEGTLVLPSTDEITGYPTNYFYRASGATL